MSIPPDSTSLLAWKIAINKLYEFIKTRPTSAQRGRYWEKSLYWEGYEDAYHEVLGEMQHLLKELIDKEIE